MTILVILGYRLINILMDKVNITSQGVLLQYSVMEILGLLIILTMMYMIPTVGIYVFMPVFIIIRYRLVNIFMERLIIIGQEVLLPSTLMEILCLLVLLKMMEMVPTLGISVFMPIFIILGYRLVNILTQKIIMMSQSFLFISPVMAIL